eukprot:Gb_25302 [translate_table: standard]
MAGMLPGVEYARRRRFHQGGCLDNFQHSRIDWNRSTTNRQSQIKHPHQSNLTGRSITQSQSEHKGDNKLNEAALGARLRLEERLRASSSVNKRHDQFRCCHSHCVHANIYAEEHRGIWLRQEVRLVNGRDQYSFDASATEGRRPTELALQNAKPSSGSLSRTCIDLLQRKIYVPVKKKGKYWIKFRASEQEDCPVCLESFQPDQMLIHLPCSHRFHSDCLVPWLDSNSHCPYCREKISIKES